VVVVMICSVVKRSPIHRLRVFSWPVRKVQRRRLRHTAAGPAVAWQETAADHARSEKYHSQILDSKLVIGTELLFGYEMMVDVMESCIEMSIMVPTMKAEGVLSW
jgi:hypothetical protein